MEIVSTNIAEPRFITINGKEVKTGIFKQPTNHPIHLGKDVVRNDEISNRKVHGGEYKACYLFAAEHYAHWKSLYPHLDWHYGMLGENLTVKGLDETQLHIGAVYRLGKALIQITQPREPCMTFAAKMGNDNILQQFIAHGRPGTYVRVLEEGEVAVGDTLELVESPTEFLSTADFFQLLFHPEKNQDHLEMALNNTALPEKKRRKLQRFKKV